MHSYQRARCRRETTPMTDGSRKSIVIIGGGASGTILAMHLMRSKNPDIRVTIIEKRDRAGTGLFG